MSVSSLSSDDAKEQIKMEESSDSASSSDPEHSNDLWEVEKIRGHWPPKAKRGDRCYYYVNWKLRKDQKEDWSDEENWIPNSGMKCPDLLKTYWNEVEKDLRKGRKPLKIYPPEKVVNLEQEAAVEQLAVKQCRKITRKPWNKEKKYHEESSDPEEEEEKPHRKRLKSFRFERKNPSWQEKINLPDDDYLLDRDDNQPILLSDEERSKAIREETKRDVGEKKKVVMRRQRKESEARKEEGERRKQALKKCEESAEKRKQLKASCSPENDDKSKRKERSLQTEPKRPTSNVDANYETVAPQYVINKLLKDLNNRPKQAGHWKAKESLFEQHLKTSKKPDNRENSLPPTAVASNTSVATAIAPVETDSASKCRVESKNRLESTVEKEIKPESSTTTTYPDAEDILPPKRKKVVHISDDENDDEPVSSSRIIAEKPITKRTSGSASPVLVKTVTVKQEPSPFSSPSCNEPYDVRNEATSSSINQLFDIDEIEPLIKDLNTTDLVIAVPGEEQTLFSKSKGKSNPKASQSSQSVDESIFLQMVERFTTECWSHKYQAVQNKLKPVYVFLFATCNEKDFAMTVFENKPGVEPMYICECVSAIEVWNTNKQLIIDAENRLRESQFLSE